MGRSNGQRHFNGVIRPLFFLGSERGAALLELAVAIPFLLLIVLGVVDYARVYYTSITVANAAQAGANAGLFNAGDATIMRTAAQTDAGSVSLDTVTAGQFCRCPGTGVVACVGSTCTGYGVPQIFDSVRVRKDVTLLMRYIGFPTAITVTRTVIMREK